MVWATENPRTIHHRESHSHKCTVWFGVSSEKIIGLRFLENAVICYSYNQCCSAVTSYPFMRFQQDGATAHTATETMALLKETLGESFISRRRDSNWPPRSQDLTASNFSFWAYLKSTYALISQRLSLN